MQSIITLFTNIYEYFFDENADYYIMNGDAEKAVKKMNDEYLYNSYDCLKKCDSHTFNKVIDLLYENHKSTYLTKIFFKFISIGGLSSKNEELYRRTMYILKKRPKDWNKYTECHICTKNYSPNVADHINCTHMWMNKLQHINSNYRHHKYLPLVVMIGMKYLNKSTVSYPLYFNRENKRVYNKYNMYIISLGKYYYENRYKSIHTQRKLEKIYL